MTLVKNCGFSEQEAKQTEANYHELYKESTEWVNAKINQAAIDGYATLAFGLRLRCPMLHKTILNSKFTPNQASAESRTIGNAVSGQSYGLLNSRAGIEIQEKIINSKYSLDIRPSTDIHDAQYFIIRDDIDCIEWLNTHLVKAIQWQELDEIKHDQVKLDGNLGLFYPNWATEIELPQNISAKEIKLHVKNVLANKDK